MDLEQYLSPPVVMVSGPTETFVSQVRNKPRKERRKEGRRNRKGEDEVGGGPRRREGMEGAQRSLESRKQAKAMERQASYCRLVFFSLGRVLAL